MRKGHAEERCALTISCCRTPRGLVLLPTCELGCINDYRVLMLLAAEGWQHEMTTHHHQGAAVKHARKAGIWRDGSAGAPPPISSSHAWPFLRDSLNSMCADVGEARRRAARPTTKPPDEWPDITGFAAAGVISAACSAVVRDTRVITLFATLDHGVCHDEVVNITTDPKIH